MLLKVQLSLSDLLGRGYFPKELPPPFKTSIFASIITQKISLIPESTFTKSGKVWCGFSSYSLARPGAIRRKLAILNPIAYYRLCNEIVTNKDELFELTKTSIRCLSNPIISPHGERAITTGSKLSSIPKNRVKSRVGKRFIFRADISNFYPSIYTHALDWAITGKVEAKKNFSPGVNRLGKRIDSLVQASQNGQTRGIPIGPDISLLLSHIILAKIDQTLINSNFTEGFRFMDDYELAFNEQPDAERALAVLATSLSDYELDLNSLKTKIEELPLEIDSPEILKLKALKLGTGSSQESDLVAIFNTAFRLTKKHPEKPILQYTVGRINKTKINERNYEITQNLLLQCATIEPGVWPIALPLLRITNTEDTPINESIESIIELTILRQANIGHSSEVAWCLWAALIFNTQISDNATKSVINMQDDVCTLLLLHAVSQKLATLDANDTASIQALTTIEQLYGDHWLLAYEAVAQEWITPIGENYLLTEPAFKFLFENGVRFYNINKITEVEGNEDASEYQSDYGNDDDIFDDDSENEEEEEVEEESEIDQKVGEATPANLERFFEFNPPNLSSPPLTQIAPNITDTTNIITENSKAPPQDDETSQ